MYINLPKIVVCPNERVLIELFGYQHFGGTYGLHLQASGYNTEDGGRMFLHRTRTRLLGYDVS
jgi:hypothetical protein